MRFTGLGYAIVATIFVEHLLLGANRTDLSLAFAVIQSLFLIAELSTKGGIDCLRAIATALIVPGILFGICLVILTLAMVASVHPDVRYDGGVLDRQAHLVGLIKLCGLASLFLAGALFGIDRVPSRRMFGMITAGGFVFGLIALALRIWWPGPKDAFSAGRLSATFISPNTAATLFGVLALLSITGLLQRLKRHLRQSLSLTGYIDSLLHNAPVEIAAFLVAITCLILTGSRAGLVLFCLSLTFLLMWEKLRGRSRSTNIALLVAISGLIITSGSQLMIGRLLSVEGDLPWHTVLLAAHWQAFLKAPFWGYGLGSFPFVNAMAMTPANMSQLVLMGAVHNVYLQWLEQAGLLGAVPMFVCVAWVIGATAWAALHGVTGKGRMRGLTAVSLFICLHGITDYALEVPSIAATWALLLGLGYGMAKSGGAPIRNGAAAVGPPPTP